MDQNSTPASPAAQAPSNASVSIAQLPDADVKSVPDISPRDGTTREVADKISSAQNVLVALSSDPSVDEMAAAIGLSLFLDKLGKHATAIYSGATPNALEFLEPEKTFAPTADALQDFVIALNKDKADHLRYKLDGDYVKIYITPYRTRIDEKDLDFSYGDYNIDLVLALNVVNGIDLDSALREHGRIMHDAVIVNITTGNPGRFGEIEWSDKTASSVSEMIAKLLYSIGGDAKISKDEATAFLTGVVAATNRFSNAKTTPATMQLASRLMESGANQQLISKNITPEVENKLYTTGSHTTHTEDAQEDATKLSISHSDDQIDTTVPAVDTSSTTDSNEINEVTNMAATTDPAIHTPDGDTSNSEQPSDLLDDLKAAEASLARAGNEIIPDTSNNPVKLDDAATDAATLETELNSNPNLTSQIDVAAVTPAEESLVSQEPSLPPVMINNDSVETPEASSVPAPVSGEASASYVKPEMVVQPPSGMSVGIPEEDTTKYGKMLESALGENGANPASMMAPQVADTPEINGVPEINYMPLPGQEILPPPPTPPIASADSVIASPYDTSSNIDTATAAPVAQPTTPIVSGPQDNIPPVTPLGPQPAMQDQVYAPQAVDPGAFKIPGI